MALKPDRVELTHDLSFFMNEVAERGGVVVISTAGSGSALDQSAALCTYAASPSGKCPVGLLMGDMVNIDQTRQHINFLKNETQKGGKVTLLTEGWVLTNRIDPAVTVAGGDVAFLGQSGYLSNVQNNAGWETASQLRVGKFLSAKDEDGYAKVYVKLPQV